MMPCSLSEVRSLGLVDRAGIRQSKWEARGRRDWYKSGCFHHSRLIRPLLHAPYIEHSSMRIPKGLLVSPTPPPDREAVPSWLVVSLSTNRQITR